MAKRKLMNRAKAATNAGGLRLETFSMDQLANLFKQDDLSHAKIDKSRLRDYFRRWQYAAATAIADAACMVEHEVQTFDGEGWSEDPSHPLALLLRRPNAWVPFRFMLNLMFLDLTFGSGEHYWYVVHDGMEAPSELWPVLGDMKAVPSKEKLIDHYLLTVNTEAGQVRKIYQVDEIVPFMLPQFQSILQGFSPMMAAAGSVKTDDQILLAQWNAFKQGIFPLYVLIMSEKDPAKRAVMREQFESLYAGARKAGKTIAISSTMELKQVSTSPREMDFMQASRQIQEAVSGMFRVPGIMMGLTKDVQNRATAEAAEYVFARWNLSPKLALVEDSTNMHLALREWDERVRVKFYSPVAEDADRERSDVDMLSRTFALSPNEVRERYGWEPAPWGNVPFIPLGMMPYGEPPPETPAPGLQRMAEEQAKPKGYPIEIRRIIAHRHNDWQQKFAKGYQKAWRGIFAGLEENFLAEFDKEPPGAQNLWPEQGGGVPMVDRWLNPDSVAKFMYDKSKPHTVRGLLLGGDFDGQLVSLPKGKKWDASSDALVAATRTFDKAHYYEVASTTHKLMTDVVAKAVEERATWSELRARIVTKFGEMKESRAANIATTETTKLMNAGGQAFRTEFDIDLKQWVTSFVNSRDTHIAMDGEPPIPNNKPFQVGDDTMMYPGQGRLAEENCNCNCVSVAVPSKTKGE